MWQLNERKGNAVCVCSFTLSIPYRVFPLNTNNLCHYGCCQTKNVFRQKTSPIESKCSLEPIFHRNHFANDFIRSFFSFLFMSLFAFSFISGTFYAAVVTIYFHHRIAHSFDKLFKLKNGYHKRQWEKRAQKHIKIIWFTNTVVWCNGTARDWKKKHIKKASLRNDKKNDEAEIFRGVFGTNGNFKYTQCRQLKSKWLSERRETSYEKHTEKKRRKQKKKRPNSHQRSSKHQYCIAKSPHEQ